MGRYYGTTTSDTKGVLQKILTGNDLGPAEAQDLRAVRIHAREGHEQASGAEEGGDDGERQAADLVLQDPAVDQRRSRDHEEERDHAAVQPVLR